MRRVVVLVLALLCVGEARADLRGGEPEPWNMTPEQRKAAGWMVYSRERQPGDVLCALGAVTIGLVWRGYGHDCLGERDAMYDMLWIEGTSAVLILSGVGVALGTNDADALNPLWRTLTYSGSMLFISSYILDIMGAAKGTSYELPEAQWQPEGVTPLVNVRLVPEDPFNFNFIFGAELQVIFGRIRVIPQASIDSSGAFSQLGGDAAFRFWQGDWRGNYLAIGNTTRYEIYETYGFNVLITLPYIEWGFDAGTLFDHLHNVLLINRLGYGFEFYDWEGLGISEEQFQDTTSLFTLETELVFNVSESTMLGLNYRQRPDLLVGGAARGLGLVGVRLQFLGDPLLIRLDTNIGTLFEFWLSVGVVLGRTSE